MFGLLDRSIQLGLAQFSKHDTHTISDLPNPPCLLASSPGMQIALAPLWPEQNNRSEEVKAWVTNQVMPSAATLEAVTQLLIQIT